MGRPLARDHDRIALAALFAGLAVFFLVDLVQDLEAGSTPLHLGVMFTGDVLSIVGLAVMLRLILGDRRGR